MSETRITVRYVGEDYWSRAVFKGDNGRFYKTTELDPHGGFPAAPREDQERTFRSLHTTDDFEGEPGWPVTLENFILANS